MEALPKASTKVEIPATRGCEEEIIKWLDGGIIYLIEDSKWVRPMQCVSKKMVKQWFPIQHEKWYKQDQ